MPGSLFASEMLPKIAKEIRNVGLSRYWKNDTLSRAGGMVYVDAGRGRLTLAG